MYGFDILLHGVRQTINKFVVFRYLSDHIKWSDGVSKNSYSPGDLSSPGEFVFAMPFPYSEIDKL